MDKTREVSDQAAEDEIRERLRAKGKRPNPLAPDKLVDCVVATGSDHHSARPGPGVIRFRSWDL